MMSNGHSLPGFQVPILGQPPVKPQQWRCTTNPEHTFAGDPPAVGLPLHPLNRPDPSQFFIARGVCVFCVLEFMTATFPVVEVTEQP